MSDAKEKEDLVFNIGDVVAGYEMIEKIDEGGFGQVFKVSKDSKTYAMKIESSSMEGGSAIKLEIDVLVDLQAKRVPNFPAFIQAGRRERYHYLVMELLGENLKSLRSKSSNSETASVGTWSRIGIQCLYVVKLLHENGFVHRDIKPANFAMGRSDESLLRGRIVFLFDFGLARRYILRIQKKESAMASEERTISRDNKPRSVEKSSDGRSKETLEERRSGDVPLNQQFKFRLARPHTDFRGTQMYASLNAHAQLELGRADDIWSLLYMIAEMISPLPWALNDNESVEDQKKATNFERLFNIPQFSRIEENLKSCNYYSFPDYEALYNVLKGVLDKSGVQWIDPYDWEVDEHKIAYEKWKEEKLRTRTIHVWEDPKDFFRRDHWKSLPRPTLKAAMKEKKMENSLMPKLKKEPGEMEKKQASVSLVNTRSKMCIPMSREAPASVRLADAEQKSYPIRNVVVKTILGPKQSFKNAQVVVNPSSRATAKTSVMKHLNKKNCRN